MFQTGSESPACPSLPRTGRLLRPGHRRLSAERWADRRTPAPVPWFLVVDEKRHPEPGPGRWPAPDEQIPRRPAAGQAQQAKVWPAEAGLLAEDWPFVGQSMQPVFAGFILWIYWRIFDAKNSNEIMEVFELNSICIPKIY